MHFKRVTYLVEPSPDTLPLAERDRERLASKKLTLRQKERLLLAQQRARFSTGSGS